MSTSPLAVALLIGVPIATGCAREASPPPAAPTPSASAEPPPSAHSGNDHDEAHHPHDDPHQGHDPMHHGHDHGNGGGYAMDFSGTDRFAAHFDDPARDAWQKPDEVIQLLELRPGNAVVDLGAGTGYFVPHLSRAVSPSGRVLALDAEPNMVKHLTERGAREGWSNVESRVVPPGDPDLPPESVDRVLIVNTWHHIGGRETYAARLRASLKPGGSVVIVDFTPESKMGPPPDHRLPAEQVVRELSTGGLAARVASETLPEQYVVVGARSGGGGKK